MLSGGRANHRDKANCAFVCVRHYVVGGEAPCLPTMLQAEVDLVAGEEITVSYGSSYGLEDLSKWALSDNFCAIVGQCRSAGMDVFSAFGDHVWSAQSTFYCQAWDEGRATPVPLVAVSVATVRAWREQGVKQVFIVRSESGVFGCGVHSLEDDPDRQGRMMILCMGGVHHVVLESAKVGT